MKYEGSIINGFPIVNDVVLYNEKNEGIKLKAIIDTGAYENYLALSAIETLLLKKIQDTFTIHPIEGRMPVSEFAAGLIIQDFNFGHIFLRQMLNIEYPVDFIIGCKFLSDKTFTYSGANNIFIIEW